MEKELAKFSPTKDTFLTIGVFDGVHLGHRYLLSQLIEQAKKHNMLSGVVTFRQHPREVLLHRARLPYLTSITEKINLLKDTGIDIVVPLSFTRDLAQLSASQFVGLLKKYLRMRGLVIGPDFALGRGREGNVDALRKLGRDMDFQVVVIPPVTVNGAVVSSTAIRDALTRGEIKRATGLIGRYFSLQGRVTTGEGRGTRLGFPTTNLDIDPKLALPADGVYATWAHIGNKTYQSMTNIGRRPTFDEDGQTVETYIVGYQGNLYGHELKIDIVERLRDEKKFDSVEELKKQMAEDVKQGKAILDSQSMNSEKATIS